VHRPLETECFFTHRLGIRWVSRSDWNPIFFPPRALIEESSSPFELFELGQKFVLTSRKDLDDGRGFSFVPSFLDFHRVPSFRPTLHRFPFTKYLQPGSVIPARTAAPSRSSAPYRTRASSSSSKKRQQVFFLLSLKSPSMPTHLNLFPSILCKVMFFEQSAALSLEAGLLRISLSSS